MISPKRLTQSFINAGKGIWQAFREEMSFRVQILAAVVVIVLMLVFPLTPTERLFLIVMICAVLVLELINSILERLVDIYKPRLDPYVRDIKDMMAAAVLIASIGALVIGLIIFIPYIMGLWL